MTTTHGSPTTRPRSTLLRSVALLAVLLASCDVPTRRSTPPDNAIPLNLDFSVPGLVDERVPWGWSFQALGWVGIVSEAPVDVAELKLTRPAATEPTGESPPAPPADGRAVYDLNDPLGNQHVAFDGTVRPVEGSFASVRVGVLVLDKDWELTETFSPWSSAGNVQVDVQVTGNSYNVQLVVEYRGHGEARVGQLRLTIDGVEAGPMLPGQQPADPTLVEWLRENGITLESTEPGAPLDDLDRLDALIGDTPLVLLGESTHGSSEFFNMKARIVKWLALRGEPVIFVIEDHPDKADRIDRFIQTGEGDAESVVEGLFGFWARQEVVDLVQWMRDATAAGEVQITFSGVDLQVPLGPLDRLQSAAQELDPNIGRRIEQALAPMRAAWGESWYPRREPAEYQQWSARALQVREVLKTAGATDRTLFDAHLVWQSAEVSGSDDMRLRDRFMADNLVWLRERSPSDSRFVFWAHNTHVRLDEEATGQWLQERYPDEVLSVGMFTDRGEYIGFDGSELRTYSLFPGPPGSIEEALHLVGDEVLALDLRSRVERDAPDVLDTPLHHRNIGLWPMDLGFYRVVIPDGFHALVYVDTTTATRPIEE